MPPKRRLRGAGRGVLANGRSERSDAFIRIPNYIFDCPAYRSLKPGPRALLCELIRRYNGRNNGKIGLGRREACAALNMTDKDTMSRYFQELETKGFIACTKAGGFNMKDPSSRRASEWRLTWERYNEKLPTKEFMRWKTQE